MGRQQSSAQQQQQVSRPKRRATNAHVFRYLQTRNPSRLEENDLKRALEASLEECPDFWPEDSASCSSSEQSNLTSASSSSQSSNSNSRLTRRLVPTKRRVKSSSSSMQHNHLNHSPSHQSNHNHHLNHHLSHNLQSPTANSHCCPMSGVHNRYKPVAKKNIYNEADFFHDGIMEYIEYELTLAMSQRVSER